MKKIFAFAAALTILGSISYAQEVNVGKGKLSIDGLLWVTYRNTEDSLSVSTFTRRNAFIGLTGNLNSWATCRLYFDVAGMTAYDLYALIKPMPSLAFTVGQFKLPLGVEMLTKSENLELIEYSLIGRTLRAPKGTRDIGVQAAYKHPFADITVAGVNGNGRNMLADDDKNKCIAIRGIIKPLKKSAIFCGANYYFGKYNLTTDFTRLGFELNYTVNPFIFKAELLTTKDDALKGMGYYVQVGYNLGMLQPMFRYSAFKYDGQDQLDEIVSGVNIRPLSDNFKIMLNYKIEKLSSTLKQSGILAQLQIAF